MAKTKRGRKYMIFGKYINKYYLKNAPILILGLAALILVDYFQLFIPELYRMVINGMNGDPVLVNGQAAVFDMEFLPQFIDEVFDKAIVDNIALRCFQITLLLPHIIGNVVTANS